MLHVLIRGKAKLIPKSAHKKSMPGQLKSCERNTRSMSKACWLTMRRLSGLLQSKLQSGAKSSYQPAQRENYFLRSKRRSPSTQCWIIAVTAPLESLTKSTPVPSMVKLFSECAMSGNRTPSAGIDRQTASFQGNDDVGRGCRCSVLAGVLSQHLARNLRLRAHLADQKCREVALSFSPKRIQSVPDQESNRARQGSVQDRVYALGSSSVTCKSIWSGIAAMESFRYAQSFRVGDGRPDRASTSCH